MKGEKGGERVKQTASHDGQKEVAKPAGSYLPHRSTIPHVRRKKEGRRELGWDGGHNKSFFISKWVNGMVNRKKGGGKERKPSSERFI